MVWIMRGPYYAPQSWEWGEWDLAQGTVEHHLTRWEAGAVLTPGTGTHRCSCSEKSGSSTRWVTKQRNAVSIIPNASVLISPQRWGLSGAGSLRPVATTVLKHSCLRTILARQSCRRKMALPPFCLPSFTGEPRQKLSHIQDLSWERVWEMWSIVFQITNQSKPNQTTEGGWKPMSSADDGIQHNVSRCRFPFIDLVWGLNLRVDVVYLFWKILSHYELKCCLTSLGSHFLLVFGLWRFIITFSLLTHWKKKKKVFFGGSNLPKMLGCFQPFMWTLLNNISNKNVLR